MAVFLFYEDVQSYKLKNYNMGQLFNIYCDESCHLEHDRQRVMVLGAVWCPMERTREVSTRLREIKNNFKLDANFELKWGKVSPSQVNYYRAVLDYFFDDDDLCFRALVAPDKSQFRHAEFGQDHDTWYFKMYFELLEVLLKPQDRYRIYIDQKDSRSAPKVRHLHDVLRNNSLDFNRRIIERLQVVASKHVEQIQLCDLLTGIVSYANRALEGSPAKLSLVSRMCQRSGYSLKQSTLFQERKVNVCHWQASATP